MLIPMLKEHLSRDVLLPPAQLALMYLQALCLYSDCFKHKTIFDSLSADSKALVDICQSLKTNNSHQNLHDLGTNPLLGKHVEWVSEQIDDDGIAKLAVFTWNFSASLQLPSQQLLEFLAWPEIENLDPALHASYSKLVQRSSTVQQFRQEVAHLLRFLKNGLKYEWNVMWKCMPMGNPFSTPQIPLFQCKFTWNHLFKARVITSTGRVQIQNVYACLLLVEKTCTQKLEYIQQANDTSETKLMLHAELASLDDLLHRLYSYILSVSQQPSASRSLKRFPMEQGMPGRLWRYVAQYAEMVRVQFPPQYPVFLNFAHESFIAHLNEAPDFKNTWFECLGDLSRCRMAVEEPNTEDYCILREEARSWYLNVPGAPSIGRIQYHLAFLSGQDKLLQLFHYTKSLVNVRRFAAAECSVNRFLFDPVLKSGSHDPVTAFIAAHGCLFKQNPVSDLRVPMQQYLSELREYIVQVGEEFEYYGTYMALCNFAAIFEYGSTTALLPLTFKSALQQDEREQGESSNMIDCGSFFALKTFSIILDQVGNEHVYPAVHAYLAFLWSMTRNDTTRHIDGLVPWQKVATFLNKIDHSNIDFNAIECDEFPMMGGACVIEDLLIDGYIWSQDYFPPNFTKYFLTCDKHSIGVRKCRCLWLGRQLQKVCYICSLFTRQFLTNFQYLEYGSQKFSPTSLAKEHEKAVNFDPFAIEYNSLNEDV